MLESISIAIGCQKGVNFGFNHEEVLEICMAIGKMWSESNIQDVKDTMGHQMVTKISSIIKFFSLVANLTKPSGDQVYFSWHLKP